MELNIQMSINQKNKTRKQKSYPKPDHGTQSETFHLTVIDGNVYQIKKTKSVKTNV
jgi:hypothetical protein